MSLRFEVTVADEFGVSCKLKEVRDHDNQVQISTSQVGKGTTCVLPLFVLKGVHR